MIAIAMSCNFSPCAHNVPFIRSRTTILHSANAAKPDFISSDPERTIQTVILDAAWNDPVEPTRLVAAFAGFSDALTPGSKKLQSYRRDDGSHS